MQFFMYSSIKVKQKKIIRSGTLYQPHTSGHHQFP